MIKRNQQKPNSLQVAMHLIGHDDQALLVNGGSLPVCHGFATLKLHLFLEKQTLEPHFSETRNVQRNLFGLDFNANLPSMYFLNPM